MCSTEISYRAHACDCTTGRSDQHGSVVCSFIEIDGTKDGKRANVALRLDIISNMGRKMT